MVHEKTETAAGAAGLGLRTRSRSSPLYPHLGTVFPSRPRPCREWAMTSRAAMPRSVRPGSLLSYALRWRAAYAHTRRALSWVPPAAADRAPSFRAVGVAFRPLVVGWRSA